MVIHHLNAAYLTNLSIIHHSNAAQVSKIVTHKKQRGVTLYRVRWKGLKSQQDTWLPERDLNCRNLLKEYLKSVLESEEEEEEQEEEDESEDKDFEVCGDD